jgi:hypothetical protein
MTILLLEHSLQETNESRVPLFPTFEHLNFADLLARFFNAVGEKIVQEFSWWTQELSSFRPVPRASGPWGF